MRGPWKGNVLTKIYMCKCHKEKGHCCSHWSTVHCRRCTLILFSCLLNKLWLLALPVPLCELFSPGSRKTTETADGMEVRGSLGGDIFHYHHPNKAANFTLSFQNADHFPFPTTCLGDFRLLGRRLSLAAEPLTVTLSSLVCICSTIKKYKQVSKETKVCWETGA